MPAALLEPRLQPSNLQLRQQLALAHGATRVHTPVGVIVVVIILAILAVLVLTLAVLLLWRNDLRRILSVWWRFRLIIADYQRVMREVPDPEEQEKALEPLHRAHGAEIVEHIVALGGMFVKVGQLMSLQQNVPKTIRDHLRVLFDGCKPLEPTELRRIVEAQLRSTVYWRREGRSFEGSAIDQVFSSFDMKPLGVASIGQVHRARLRHAARDVVVKVQFPDAKDSFQSDLWCLKNMIEMTKGSKNWVYSSVVEIEQQLAQEFNFRQEAANIDTMRAMLLPELASVVELPEVRHDLTTDSLITMSFLDGTRLDRALAKKLEDAGLGDVAKVLRMSSGDPESSPPEDEAPEAQAAEGEEEPQEPPPEVLAAADCHRIVETLFDVWGRCIVRAGVFNADPHPGNVLLMPDGRLGLLDFGQVKQLSAGCRKAIASTVLGLLRADVPSTAETVRQMGINVKLDDADTRLWYHASVVFERKGLLPWSDECWGKEGGGHASEMVFVVRSLHLLKGVALGLGFPMSCAESWGKWAAETAEEEEEVGRLVKDINSVCFAGTYDLRSDGDGTEREQSSMGSFTLQHAQGGLVFGGTWSQIGADGARQEHRVDHGYMVGRVVELKAGDQVIRGIVREGGDRISHIRTWNLAGEELGRFTAVRTSGAMGRAFNSMKAKAAAAVFRFMPAASKAKIMQAAVKSAKDAFEQSPEG